jgi:hypothetical protein
MPSSLTFAKKKKVPSFPKESGCDNTLVLTKPTGERVSIPVPAGVTLNMDIAAMHFNRTFPLADFSPCKTKSNRSPGMGGSL